MYRPVNQPSGSLLKLDVSKADYELLGSGSGEACADFLLGLPVSGQNTYQKAVSRAVASKGGDILIQTSSDLKLTGIPILYEQHCISVEGVVVKLK